MKTNTKTVKTRATIYTHEGAPAVNTTAKNNLRRSVMSCLLWENEFYENGEDIAARIAKLVKENKGDFVASTAIEAREKMKLRHAPLFLVREMARNPDQRQYVADTLDRVIQRADELSEFLSIYWKSDKDQPLASQVKKGLAQAFTKFDEYSLAKYNMDGDIKLRDVLFLCHAKPLNKEQENLWKRLINDELKTPDTWEVALSAGADKKATFERLIAERKLGALALLRNLRNMEQAGVDRKIVSNAILSMNAERVLPFRFISAARHAPHFEPELEQAMFKCLEGAEKLSGVTKLLIDVSGSMDHSLSAKSDLRRIDAACALAILLREICEKVEVYTFSSGIVEVAPSRGFALRDAIVNSQAHSNTHLGSALDTIKYGTGADRLIVITDEQSHDKVGKPNTTGYMLNVASSENGVGYGAWNHVDGWSESIVRYITALEQESKG